MCERKILPRSTTILNKKEQTKMYSLFHKSILVICLRNLDLPIVNLTENVWSLTRHKLKRREHVSRLKSKFSKLPKYAKIQLTREEIGLLKSVLAFYVYFRPVLCFLRVY